MAVRKKKRIVRKARKLKTRKGILKTLPPAPKKPKQAKNRVLRKNEKEALLAWLEATPVTLIEKRFKISKTRLWTLRRSAVGHAYIKENLDFIHAGFREDRIIIGKAALQKLEESMSGDMKETKKTVREGPEGKIITIEHTREPKVPLKYLEKALEISGVIQPKHELIKTEAEQNDKTALLDSLKSNSVINDTIQEVLDAASRDPES